MADGYPTLIMPVTSQDVELTLARSLAFVIFTPGISLFLLVVSWRIHKRQATVWTATAAVAIATLVYGIFAAAQPGEHTFDMPIGLAIPVLELGIERRTTEIHFDDGTVEIINPNAGPFFVGQPRTITYLDSNNQRVWIDFEDVASWTYPDISHSFVPNTVSP